MTWEEQYTQLGKRIISEGEDRPDRTGTGTRAIFGQHLDINLKNGFPLLTTKKMAIKAIKSELLWFLEGSTDERRLAEIHFGTRDVANSTIWTDNAKNPLWTPRANFNGDLGNVYGKQWRAWTASKLTGLGDDNLNHPLGGTTYFNAKVLVKQFDQIKMAIDKIKNNPTDRRIVVSAWNVGEIDDMALPPCHMFFQFFVSNTRELSCQMYQRSVDTALGLPFNIASYAMLTHMIAQVTNCTPGRLIMNLGDTHVYRDHIDDFKIQLERTALKAPSLWINPSVRNIDDFKMDDIMVNDYNSHDAIKFKMST